RVLVYRPLLLGLRAEALAGARRIEDALRTLDEAGAIAERTGERSYDAELWRLRGNIELAKGGAQAAEAAEAAEACYRRALRCAASQGSVMFELRASLALAQLWSRRGQGAEAAVLLGRAQGRIVQPAEGHDLAAA